MKTGDRSTSIELYSAHRTELKMRCAPANKAQGHFAIHIEEEVTFDQFRYNYARQSAIFIFPDICLSLSRDSLNSKSEENKIKHILRDEYDEMR